MASIALGAIGAGIGSAFGAAQLGWSAGIEAGGLLDALFAPHNPPLRNLRISGSQYGSAIPYIFGKMRIGTNVIWATDLVEHTQNQGGGSAASMGAVNYTYTVSFAALVSAGPLTAIHRIWGEDVLLYDDGATVETMSSITIYLGSTTQPEDPVIVSNVTNTPGYRGRAYIVFQDLDLTPWGQRMPQITVEADGGAATVGSVVSSLAELVGVTSSQLDMSGGTDVVQGYAVHDRKSAASAISTLLKAYPVDLIEADGLLRLVRRGGACVATVMESDLGSSSGHVKPAVRMHEQRDQSWTLPSRLDVQFYDPSQLYQQSSEQSIRQSQDTLLNMQSIALHVCMDETTARQTAERLLYTQWRERTQYHFSLPPGYIYLSPADPIYLPVNGINVRCRLILMDMAPLGEIRCTAVLDGLDLIVQYAPGAPVTNPTQSVYGPGNLQVAVWCGNALRDSDAQQLGIYAAATWDAGQPIAQLYWSRDNGNTWQKLLHFDNWSVMGNTLTSLPPFSQTAVLDMENSVDVQLGTRGSLVSGSIGDLLAGGNMCLIGNEYVQFMTATPIGSQQYRLSGLLRGRYGTDYAWVSHAAGETFAVVDIGAALYQDMDSQLLGKPVLMKAIQNGGDLSTATAFTVTMGGAMFMPYSPCSMTISQDGSNNLNLAWLRRARYAGAWADGGDVPETDPPESYEVDVCTISGVVVRTLSVNASSAQYTSAERSTDAIAGTIVFNIYEMNATIGRGYPGTIVWNGTGEGIVPGSAVMQGAGKMSISGNSGVQGSATMQGAGKMSASGNVGASLQMEGSGEMNATSGSIGGVQTS